MDSSINTRPLLERDDSDSDIGEDPETSDQRNPQTTTVSETSTGAFKIPRDRYHAAYWIFYLLGVTTLLPWNFFITADPYWMFKFHEVSNSSNFSSLTTKGRTVLQAEFSPYLSLASNIPNTVFLCANTILSHKIPLRSRMTGTLLSMLALFITTTSLVKVNTDPWQQIFFILTLTIVVCINVAGAIFQGSVFGMVGAFPHHYITAVVGGQALGGVFAALANIISLSLGTSPETSALAYFMVGDFVLAAALGAYLLLAASSFFKFYYERSVGRSSLLASMDDGEDSVIVLAETTYLSIVKKIWIHCVSIWLVFVVTLAMFPAVMVLVESMEHGSKRPWTDIYFGPVITFLLFNICDYTGRLFAGRLRRPHDRSWVLLVLSGIRTGFVPLLMLCNAQPRTRLPVVLSSDLYYALTVAAFALSNGYLANICFISVSRVVPSHEQVRAATIMTAFLGLGTCCGAGLSLLMVRLL